MFDVAPTELLLVAVIALVVIGPKDLPRAMRFVGQWVGKARRMAGHFRTGIDAMMREAELEEMEKKWREHNEAIMRAHPQISLTPDMPSASSADSSTMGATAGDGVTITSAPRPEDRPPP